MLQYIESPYTLLSTIFAENFEYIIIDRTPFIDSEKDRITVQKVHPKIYKASYPCWFFSEEKFKQAFEVNYELITEFTSTDQANIKSVFKGFLYKQKK